MSESGVYEVRVEGLRFHGPHGVFESERAPGNDFRARIAATVNGSADRSDRLFDTVDYAGLAKLVLEVSGSGTFNTLERLAGRCADLVLERFSKVVAVEVTVEKLTPPMEAVVESCSATVVRER